MPFIGEVTNILRYYEKILEICLIVAVILSIIYIKYVILHWDVRKIVRF